MKHRYLFGVLCIWIFICAYSFQSIFSDAKEKAIDELNAQQMIHAIQAQHGIEEFFQNTIALMNNITKSDHIIHLDDQGRQELDFAYKMNPGRSIQAITRVDEKGFISYTTPYKAESIGRDISSQAHVKTIFKTKKPTISDVFTAVQGYRAVALHVPIIKEKHFYGTLAILIDFRSISKRFLENIKLGNTGYAWMTSEEGIELFCPVPGHTGNSVFDNCKDAPTILSMAQKMVAGKQGKAFYEFDMVRDNQVKLIKKHAIYKPIKIVDGFWTIVVASSEDELLANLVTFKKKLLVIFTLLLLGSFIFSYYGMKSWGIVREAIIRKRAEAALRHQTNFSNKVIESSPVSLWVSDENGTAIRANPACLKFFGATQSEVIGKYNLFQDLVIESNGFMPIVKNVFEKGEPADFVLDYNFKDVGHVDAKNATHKIINSILTPVLDTDGKVSNVIVQTIDLTEIKKAEAEKIQSQKIADEHEKLALVGQVAGKMAHDFNNVLGIIMGNTELSLMDCTESIVKKKLELIYEQTVRGKNLTKNLVAFAKDQEPKQEFFNINEKINLVIDLLKKDLEGIELLKQEKPNVPEVLADPGMIEHALVNLIQNSIHAISKTQNPKIIVRTYRHKGTIYFEIEDNGCGIPKEYLNQIFEPSFTLKGIKDITGSYSSTIKGTGYGMANVKKYVERHGGDIHLETMVQSGTKFTIGLPIFKKELSIIEKDEISKSKIYSDHYILLVEDEQAISDIQYRLLTQEPYFHKVDLANNAQFAMDLVDRNTYDFVSLDYLLPGDANGMDVYHHIRKTNKTVPILFISGNIEFLESIKELKQKDPYLDHLSKPCKNIDYVNCINKLFERRE